MLTFLLINLGVRSCYNGYDYLLMILTRSLNPMSTLYLASSERTVATLNTWAARQVTMDPSFQEVVWARSCIDVRDEGGRGYEALRMSDLPYSNGKLTNIIRDSLVKAS